MILGLTIAALVCAALPALMYAINLRLFRRAPPASGSPSVSVLIPARNEEANIGPALEAVLASVGADIEVVVYDDGSEDATASIVQGLASADQRVRYVAGVPLPDGWCGKMHACHRLAAEARKPLLLFVDADVRLTPAAVGRMAAFLTESDAGLASGFPRQRTESLPEAVLIPLIHFVLLGFLPLARMRRSTHPAYAAGIGQLFIAQRGAYDRTGGHEAIRNTLHDGIELPRLFRKAGLRTDICDAADIAECRMYAGARAVWAGLLKNAGEGLGAPSRIVPVTALLGLGQVAPPVLAIGAWLSHDGNALAFALAALALSYLPRLAALVRLRESRVGALLHPIGIALLLLIQWQALLARVLKRPSVWRGRAYP